jgi:hypothetical protein
MKGGCGCALADKNACTRSIVSRRCVWCESQNLCDRREHIDDRGNHVPACDCSNYNYDTCVIASANNGCKWCGGANGGPNLCSNTNSSRSDYNYNCDCRTFTDYQCDFAIASGNFCRFCNSIARCSFSWDFTCDCLLIPGEALCDMANQTTCSWCSNSNTCANAVPPQNQSGTGLASSGCTWCRFGDVETCAESCTCTALDEKTCEIVAASPDGVCHYCSDQTLNACNEKSEPNLAQREIPTVLVRFARRDRVQSSQQAQWNLRMVPSIQLLRVAPDQRLARFDRGGLQMPLLQSASVLSRGVQHRRVSILLKLSFMSTVQRVVLVRGVFRRGMLDVNQSRSLSRVPRTANLQFGRSEPELFVQLLFSFCLQLDSEISVRPLQQRPLRIQRCFFIKKISNLFMLLLQ